MMRRSKRQNKSMSDSSDQFEQKKQQLDSKQLVDVIQKKSKETKSKQQDDLKINSRNNFQSMAAKKELDSVAVNLATQLEKVSNIEENCENIRPKRVRKITEKAEQELLAKQKKVKSHQKKESKTTNDQVIDSSKTISTQSSLNQSKKSVLLKNQCSFESEILNNNQQDDQDMDIENLQIYDQKTQLRSSSINNVDEEKMIKNSILLQKEDSYEEESEGSSEEEDVQSQENNDLESEQKDEFDQRDDQKQEYMNIECEGAGLSKMVDVQDAATKNLKQLKQSQIKGLENKSILKASNKLNKKKEKNELLIQNILNSQISNKQNKVVKKRNVSQEKLLNNQSNSVSKQEEDILTNKDEISKQDNEIQETEQQCQSGKSSIDFKKQKSSISKKLKKEQLNQQEIQKKNQEDSEEELEQSQNEDNENEMRNEDDDGTNVEGNNNSKAKKMPWSEEEDKLVISLVEQYGPQKWTFIAQHIPGRIGKQCRERWHNHLNPKINKEPWGDDEEWILFLCHKLKGNKWAEITQYIPGRTDNAIKNHWNSSMKKRIPELYQRLTQIKCGEDLEYYITPQYKQFEDEILKQLLSMSDDGADSYFVQTTRRRRNNNSSLVQSIPKSLPIKSEKSKIPQENHESQQAEDEQESIPLKKKQLKASVMAATKLNSVQYEEQGISLNNHFTPNNNNKYSSLHNKSLKNLSSAAQSTADVKEIIERIPQNLKEFENFRKQIILYSDEYYQQQNMIQQTHHDNDSSLDILSADKGNANDVNINDTTKLEKFLETPLSVEKYVQQNPVFAGIVRSALKYQSCQKNLTFMSHVKKNDSGIPSENITNFDNQLSATSTHHSTIQQKKSSNSHLDQSIDDDLQTSTKNGQEIMKKKRGRKPKANKEQEDNTQNSEEKIVEDKNVKDEGNNNYESSQNPNRQKKTMHGHPPYFHPMYMMNHHHPYYGNHPHHPGYLPPPPHMMGHGQPMMQGYPHPHHLQHPLPPPHHVQHHYMKNGGSHRHPPQPHHSQIREGQGHMMIPPPPPHHYQQMKIGHHMMPYHHQMYMGGNHNSMNLYSESNNENPSFQTPRKYQKNNKGDRSLFKSLTPTITENYDKQNNYDDKNNKIKINNFPSDEEYNNFFSNNSFQKENTNPNIQQSSLNQNKESSIPTVNNGNLNSQQSNTNSNSQNSNGQSQNFQSNMNGNGQNQNHNLNFITPNKYDTPSKLLDFDSEVRKNCNSVDIYFNMRDFSSNNKITNLYANQNNHFQQSQNSAFKSYPNMNIDFQDTPSAKKLSFC